MKRIYHKTENSFGYTEVPYDYVIEPNAGQKIKPLLPTGILPKKGKEEKKPIESMIKPLILPKHK